MLDAERIELALDQRGGPYLFETQLGMAMDLASELGRPSGHERTDQRRTGWE